MTTPPHTPPRAKPLRFETLAVHAGHGVDPTTGAVTEPIHLSTTFERDGDGAYPRGYLYARNDNPNRHGLEAALAALEGGAACAAFASGLAAVTAVFQGLQPGDHVVAPNDIYHGTANVLKHLFAKWRVGATFVDMTDLDAVRAALKAQPTTRIVWIETPSNPLMRCVDIAAVADIATAAGARAVADNTFASPALQRPLALGCSLVVHATTKYLGGRSDVLGGAVVSRDDDAAFADLRTAQLFGGAVPSPFDCWLVMRSLPTLPQRMRAHCANAATVAAFLAAHPRVEAVHYPGLADNPFHALAARQESGAFEKPAARAIASAAWLVPLLLSWSTSPSPSHPQVFSWYRSLRQPPWKPPDIAIPMAWLGIQSFLAAAAYRLLRRPPSVPRTKSLAWLGANVVGIGSWSWFFFGKRRLFASTVASAGLLASSAAYVNAAKEEDETAAKQGLPLVVWVAFATVHTAEIWRRNR